MPSCFSVSSRFLRLLPLAAALAVFSAPSAFAQEADEPSDLQKLLGAAGLLELPKDPIDYSERSPLVVPPSVDLPKPGETADVKRLNPEWPVDQDIKRAKASAKEAKKPIDAPNDLFYAGRLMKPKDWKGPATSRSGEGEVVSEDEKQGMYRLSPSQLGFKGWDKKEEAKFEREPDRTSLLQPPPGYQTPSPNAPYGIVEEDKGSAPAYAKDRNDDRNQTAR